MMQGESSPSLRRRSESQQRTARSKLCARLHDDELSVRERQGMGCLAKGRHMQDAREGIYYKGVGISWGDKQGKIEQQAYQA